MFRTIPELQQQVIASAARLRGDGRAFDPEWVRDLSPEAVRQAPVLICGSSMFGSICTISAQSAGLPIQFKGVVDDYQAGRTVLNLPVLSSVDLLRWCRKHPETICINASLGVGGWKHFNDLAADFGLRMLDWTSWMRLAGVPPKDRVFASWQPAILDRLDAFIALGKEWMDEQSQRVLLTMLLFHLETDRSLLLDLYLPVEWSYFQSGAFSLTDDEVLVDGGANIGQTTQRFLQLTQRRFKRVHAFEPDAGNAAELRALVRRLAIPDADDRIKIHEAALSDHVGSAGFDQRGNEGSRLLIPGETPGTVEVKITTIDAAVAEPVTMIKLDVEGFEPVALTGAQRTLREHRPKLAVCAYHQPGDPLEIVRLLQEMDLGYRYSLRLHSASFYDLVLYACSR